LNFRRISKLIKKINESLHNFNDMISSQLGAGLGGMGYSRRPYKKTIPYCKFVRG
jgi:hypothetical protein